MAPTDGDFQDGTHVHLDVGAPWWSWLWLGLIYQPAHASVSASSPVESVVIDTMGFSGTGALAQVTPQGQSRCTNCRGTEHYVQNFGFPLPPWLGGGGFQGVGFRATVGHGSQVIVLHDHWGSKGDTQVTGVQLPADFV
jgi:hypothetical protein